MALSQEFWLQRRRREAQATASAGGPRPTATVYQSGPRAPMASILAPSTAVAPPAGSPMRPPISASWPTLPGAPGAGPAGPATGPPLAFQPPGGQNPFVVQPAPPYQMHPAGVMPVGNAAGYLGMPGMNAWLAPRRPMPAAEPDDDRGHKEWNSDDEEIDEWGRKKVSSKATGSSATSGHDVGAAPGLKSDPKADLQKPSDSAEPAKKGKAGLSAKQQAALERLHRRGRATGTTGAVGNADPSKPSLPQQDEPRERSRSPLLQR